MSHKIAISSTGKYQCVVDKKNIWTSDDYGDTWNYWVEFIGMPNFTPKSVCISADGKYQTLVDTETLCRSEDFGKTWNAVEIDCVMGVWEDVAMSASGEYQVAVVSATYMLPIKPNTVWISSDYGKSFKEALAGGDLCGVCVSDSGEYQTAVSKNGSICVGSNYGQTWTCLNYAPVQWKECVMGTDGSFQTAIGNKWIVDQSGNNQCTGVVYRSDDYGISWTMVPIPDMVLQVNSVAMSNNCQHQTVVTDDTIWMSDSYGVEGSWNKFKKVELCKTTKFTSCAMSGSGIYQAILGPKDEEPHIGITELMSQNYSSE